MIYPFKLIKCEPHEGGRYGVTIEVSTVVKYLPNPANPYRSPLIQTSELFYTVEADTEEQALEKVAGYVASNP